MTVLGYNDEDLDINIALDVASHFRLEANEAKSIIYEIKTAVSNWQEIANKYNISEIEKKQMKTAFITL
jgi:serine/threonine-protein kinase HipA